MTVPKPPTDSEKPVIIHVEGKKPTEPPKKRRRFRLPLIPSLIVFGFAYWGFTLFLESNAKQELETSFGGLLTCSEVDIQVLNGKVVFKDLVFVSPLENVPTAPMAVIDELTLNNLWSASFFSSNSTEFELRNVVINLAKAPDGRLNLGEFERVLDQLEKEEKEKKKKSEKSKKDDSDEDEEDVYTIGSWILNDVEVRFWRQLDGKTWSSVALNWDRLAMQNLTTDPKNTKPTGLQLSGLTLDYEGSRHSDLSAQPASAPTTEKTRPLLTVPALQATLQLPKTEDDPSHVESLRVFNPEIVLNLKNKPFAHEELDRFFDDFFDEPEELLPPKKEKKKKTENTGSVDGSKSVEAQELASAKPKNHFKDIQVNGGTLSLEGATSVTEFFNLQGTVNWVPEGEKTAKLSGSTEQAERAFTLALTSEGSPWASETGKLSLSARCRDLPLENVLIAANAESENAAFPRLLTGILTAYLSLEITPNQGSGAVEVEMQSLHLTPDKRSMLERLQPAGIGGLVQSLLPKAGATEIPKLSAEFKTNWSEPSLLVLYSEFVKAIQQAKNERAVKP